jgi:Protein of unknown function (DUF2934)
MIDRAQALDNPMVETKSREERVREAAYQRYLMRDGDQGDPEIDWLAAEAQIDAEDAP